MNKPTAFNYQDFLALREENEKLREQCRKLTEEVEWLEDKLNAFVKKPL